MNRLFLCSLMVICCAGVACADNFTWDGGGADDNWATKENWDVDATPGDSDDALIASGGTAYIDANSIVVNRVDVGSYGGDGSLTIVTGGLTAGSLFMGIGDPAAVGQLTVDSGVVSIGGSVYVGYQNCTGILTMNAGSFECGKLVVGYGTWGSDVTKGYVYIHGGTVTTYDLTLTDQGGGTGTHEALIELDGSGELRLHGDRVTFLNGEIGAGRIYGLNGQTVIAYYDEDLQQSIVRISTGVADCAEATVLAAAAGAPLLMDLDGDCYVGVLDLSALAADWLRCYDPLDEDCEHPWDVVVADE